MQKQIKIRIFPDGTISSQTVKIKGKSCTKYAEILETLLDAKIINTKYTSEYYEQNVEEYYQNNDEVELRSNNG